MRTQKDQQLKDLQENLHIQEEMSKELLLQEEIGQYGRKGGDHMHKHKTKVWSDRHDEYKVSQEAYGMGTEDVVPVDLYGKRVTQNKGDASNLQNIGDDIKEFYDLEGEYGLEGGE